MGDLFCLSNVIATESARAISLFSSFPSFWSRVIGKEVGTANKVHRIDEQIKNKLFCSLLGRDQETSLKNLL